MIDLHMHSFFSDGSDAPEKLVSLAAEAGLTAIALTDHDTVDGLPRFMAAGEDSAVQTIPGVEISVDAKLPPGGHMHILGLFIDYQSEALQKSLGFMVEQRRLRAEKMIERLNENGIEANLQELLEIAGEGAIGRPHIAELLIRKGLADSVQDAFDRYLGQGKPIFVEKIKLNEADAIRLIHDAGGLAILAHPQFLGYDKPLDVCRRIEQLQQSGLDGFEVHYPDMPAELKSALLQLAERTGMVAGGGSDYHGTVSPGNHIGSGRNNNLVVPDTVLAQMQQRLKHV